MNLKEKNMLLVAAAAINIPFVRNRASGKGLFEYENEMRDIVPLFHKFIEAAVDVYKDGLDPLRPLIELSERHVEFCKRSELSPQWRVEQFLRTQHRVQPTPLSLSSAETLGDNSRRG